MHRQNCPKKKPNRMRFSLALVFALDVGTPLYMYRRRIACVSSWHFLPMLQHCPPAATNSDETRNAFSYPFRKGQWSQTPLHAGWFRNTYQSGLVAVQQTPKSLHEGRVTILYDRRRRVYIRRGGASGQIVVRSRRRRRSRLDWWR